jgi:5-methylthioribose kinase
LIELTSENAAEYLGRECVVKPLGGGVSNTVLLAESAGERMVVKQALGKLRVQQDWFSDRSRIFREAAALRMLAPILPEGSVPRVLFEDRDNFVYVMSAATPGSRTWKSLLFEGDARAEVAQRIGRMLAAIIRGSYGSREFDELFGDQTIFDQLRIDPYYRTTALRHPDLAGAIHALIEDSGRRRVSLVHGDWSPKNFLIDGDRIMAIDFEVIHYGDPSFDAAFLLNHLLLKSYHFPQWRERFRALAMQFWAALREGLPPEWDWFERATIDHLGCLLLARVDGKSPVEYITDGQEKQTIREHAREMIIDPPESIARVFSC